ncbi:hypothetical protein PsYK624_060740 [Phanerochaete sordida]|uniref:G domain-containing protein n=1 Tax=Phanerochaete sordida TaxID=48140 RepID=A0A9P3G9Q4_9APHY|nr:hypothetical protein PsYK624_060740 [Phanerochaete sordida]
MLHETHQDVQHAEGNELQVSEQLAEARDGSELEEVVIAVMGASGTGKSTFINLLSGSNLRVGDGLRSCTSKVETSCSFPLLGKLVTLIDTPGFDDTIVSETDILTMIAVYLSASYQAGYKLNGVIYMHRISDYRVGGISLRNFNMFRKLCGDETLTNVAIVTTFWSEVDLARDAERERQLSTDNLLFASIIQGGAIMLRHDGMQAGALSVVERFTDKKPRILRIQRELVEEGKSITETAAGMELVRRLSTLQESYVDQLTQLQTDIDDMFLKRDMSLEKELEHVRQDLLRALEKTTRDRDRISREYAEQRAAADLKVQRYKQSFMRNSSRWSNT